MAEQATTEHQAALDVQCGVYTLVLTGPLNAIDDMFDAMRDGLVEQQLAAALDARIAEQDG